MNFCAGHLTQTKARRAAGAKIHLVVFYFRHKCILNCSEAVVVGKALITAQEQVSSDEQHERFLLKRERAQQAACQSQEWHQSESPCVVQSDASVVQLVLHAIAVPITITAIGSVA